MDFLGRTCNSISFLVGAIFAQIVVERILRTLFCRFKFGHFQLFSTKTSQRLTQSFKSTIFVALNIFATVWRLQKAKRFVVYRYSLWSEHKSEFNSQALKWEWKQAIERPHRTHSSKRFCPKTFCTHYERARCHLYIYGSLISWRDRKEETWTRVRFAYNGFF